MQEEKSELNFTEETGMKMVGFLKKIKAGEAQIFMAILLSTIFIVSVMVYLFSDVNDIESHDEMMLKTGAGELLSDNVTCKSGILYYKSNGSIALAIDSGTDKPFHCKVAENKIFLK